MELNSPTFRPVEEADVAPLLDIYNHYVRTSTATFHIADLAEAEFRPVLFPGYPRFGAWTISVGTRVAGYVILARYRAREAYDGTAEVTVYLHPDFVGKGCGRTAVEFAKARAVERKFHVLMAVICGENSASIALFERLGYTKCAHHHQVGRKFGRWLDVVCYEQLLEPD